MMSIRLAILLALQSASPEMWGDGWFSPSVVSFGTHSAIPAIHRQWRDQQLLIWSTVSIDPLEGQVVLDIAASGCSGSVTDYRQNATISRQSTLELESSIVQAEAARMFDVLRNRCGVRATLGEDFMKGFEDAFSKVIPPARKP
jgi:hypothetical protein